MVATAVTYSPVADVFTCNPSNICATFYTISTDSVLARFLCNSRAPCYTPVYGYQIDLFTHFIWFKHNGQQNKSDTRSPTR